MNDSVFIPIFFTRPSDTLLPNLHTLAISDSATHVASSFRLLRYTWQFLHKGIHHFGIYLKNETLSQDGREALLDLFNTLVVRCPFITELVFASFVARTRLQDPLGEVLMRFSELREISLSSGALTGRVIRGLATLPKLESIRLIDLGDFTVSVSNHAIDEQDFLVVREIDCSTSFPALRRAALQGNLGEIVENFLQPRVFKNLDTLEIDLFGVANAATLKACLEVLRDSCTNLRHMAISRRELMKRSEEKECDEVTWDSLRCLTFFRHLYEFKLQWVRHVELSDLELAALVQGCVALRILHLNPEPVILPAACPSLSLAALPLIITSEIEDLSLFVRTDNIALHPTPSSMTPQCLRKIQRISFGTSTVDSERIGIVAFYLSKVLPSSCKLIVDESSFSFLWRAANMRMARDDGRYKSFKRLRTNWQLVEERFRFLSLSRAEERQGMRRMQMEIEGLKAELRDLKAQLTNHEVRKPIVTS